MNEKQNISTVEEAGRALYMNAISLLLHHDAFMLAWRDKFHPKSLVEMDNIRAALFAACEKWRDTTGWRPYLTRPRGISHSIAGANQLSLNRKDLVQRFAMLSTLNDPDTS